jgi:ATP-binding cassette, subfamily F, member 3
MVTLVDISKAFAGRTLFAEASLQVNPRDRIGVVGANGIGKSTLFSLILGQLEPDSGKILIEPKVTLGHLPQETAPVQDETVLELATAITPELAELQRQIKAWENAHPDAVLDLDDSVHSRYRDLGGNQLEAKAKQTLTGLGFRESDFNRPAREMSGGWVMRAHLARLLVQEPDLLMLDEPTNHLDLETLLWFQATLKEYRGAVLVISHDREFLNFLVGDIVEIRLGSLMRYTGNYEDYLVQREAHEANLMAAYKNQQRKIGQLMRFVERFRAKNTKAAQAQSKLKQIERMDVIEAPVDENREISFAFPQPQRSGLKVVTLQEVDHAYGQHVVYRGLNFVAERGQRIVLVGPNGAGKSTMLKLLAGVLPVQAGARTLGHNVKAGYYSQYRVEMLNPEHTVYEEASNTPQRLTETFIRTVLGSFLFCGDDIFKPVSVLSGGEKSRLALIKLLLDPPNLLLMDEPTTHLDLSSIDALLEALDQFEGTIIFISHDVYFIRALANHVIHINAGEVKHYPGGYQYYLDKTAVTAREGLTAGDRAEAAGEDLSERISVKNKEQKRLEAEERQERYKRRSAQQKIVTRLEERIAELEERQTELNAELERPETYQKPGAGAALTRESRDIADELKLLTAEWETAATRLAEIDLE